jgi:hypothetical protein
MMQTIMTPAVGTGKIHFACAAVYKTFTFRTFYQTWPAVSVILKKKHCLLAADTFFFKGEAWKPQKSRLHLLHQAAAFSVTPC